MGEMTREKDLYENVRQQLREMRKEVENDE